MKIVIAVCLVVLVAAFAYVRLAVSDPDRWHVRPTYAAPGDYPERNGFEAVRQITTTPAGVLEAFDLIARQSPRTVLFAGTPEAGMMTYETRSAVWGFPDYTTVAVEEGEVGPVLLINGRSRFGASDVGVNAARVKAWIALLGPLVVDPDQTQ